MGYSTDGSLSGTWSQLDSIIDLQLVMAYAGEPFYPKNHVGRGWGIGNSAMGAVRLPKTLVLTIDDFVSAQPMKPRKTRLQRRKKRRSSTSTTAGGRMGEPIRIRADY